MANIDMTQTVIQAIKQIFIPVNGGAKKAVAELNELFVMTGKFNAEMDKMGDALSKGLFQHGEFTNVSSVADEIGGSFVDMDSAIKNTTDSLGIVTKVGRELGSMTDVLNESMMQRGGFDDNRKRAEELGNEYDKLVKKQKKNTKATEDGAKGYKAINFEFLGIMFFGQSVAKVFGEMLKPATELFGVNELWGIMMQDLMLPVIEDLMPLFFGMFDFFTGLPEPVKKVIGVLTIIGAVMGNLLSTVGTLTLGLQAIGIAFGAPGLTKGAASFGKHVIGMLGPIALVTAAIVLAVIAWNTNFAGFRDSFQAVWENIKDIFGNLIDFVVNVFTGDLSGALQNVKNIFKAVFDSIGEMVALLLESFGILFGLEGASNLAAKMRRELHNVSNESLIGLTSKTTNILGATNPLTPRIGSQIGVVNNILNVTGNPSEDNQRKMSSWLAEESQKYLT